MKVVRAPNLICGSSGPKTEASEDSDSAIGLNGEEGESEIKEIVNSNMEGISESMLAAQREADELADAQEEQGDSESGEKNSKEGEDEDGPLPAVREYK